MDPFSTTLRDELVIATTSDESGELTAALQGAHVITWSPRHTPHPVLFLSPRSLFRKGKAIRGGVPLCFPWFGPKADDAAAPQHGFARTREWQLAQEVTVIDGHLHLEFTLASDPATRAAWPHDFTARLSARARERLALALEVRNTSSTPCTFSAALHTYLAVSDVRQIAIRGLEHTEYLDKAGGASVRRREGEAPVRFTGETDRVYLDTTATCIVDDPGWSRRIHVAKSGSRSTVIWNPWTDKARAMADLGEEAWPGFVCVETCNAGDDTVTLAPGAVHTLATEIRVETM